MSLLQISCQVGLVIFVFVLAIRMDVYQLLRRFCSCYKDGCISTFKTRTKIKIFVFVSVHVIRTLILVTAHEFQHTKILIFRRRFSCVIRSGLNTSIKFLIIILFFNVLDVINVFTFYFFVLWISMHIKYLRNKIEYRIYNTYTTCY